MILLFYTGQIKVRASKYSFHNNRGDNDNVTIFKQIVSETSIQ
jgi:hypothetical protein